LNCGVVAGAVARAAVLAVEAHCLGPMVAVAATTFSAYSKPQIYPVRCQSLLATAALEAPQSQLLVQLTPLATTELRVATPHLVHLRPLLAAAQAVRRRCLVRRRRSLVSTTRKSDLLRRVRDLDRPGQHPAEVDTPSLPLLQVLPHWPALAGAQAAGWPTTLAYKSCMQQQRGAPWPRPTAARSAAAAREVAQRWRALPAPRPS